MTAPASCQREAGIWLEKQKIALIDSIIRKLPIQELQILKKEDCFQIFDGLQKTDSFFRFLNDQFEFKDPPDENAKFLINDETWYLSRKEIPKEEKKVLAGKRFSEFPQGLQQIILETELDIKVMNYDDGVRRFGKSEEKFLSTLRLSWVRTNNNGTKATLDENINAAPGEAAAFIRGITATEERRQTLEESMSKQDEQDFENYPYHPGTSLVKHLKKKKKMHINKRELVRVLRYIKTGRSGQDAPEILIGFLEENQVLDEDLEIAFENMRILLDQLKTAYTNENNLIPSSSFSEYLLFLYRLSQDRIRYLDENGDEWKFNVGSSISNKKLKKLGSWLTTNQDRITDSFQRLGKNRGVRNTGVLEDKQNLLEHFAMGKEIEIRDETDKEVMERRRKDPKTKKTIQKKIIVTNDPVTRKPFPFGKVDPKRSLTINETNRLRESIRSTEGKLVCSLCGKDLDEDKCVRTQNHHKKMWTSSGRTKNENIEIMCNDCHVEHHKKRKQNEKDKKKS